MKLGIGASSRGDAYIYQYGWSRPPEIMRTKCVNFEHLYRDDATVAEMSLGGPDYA